MKRFILFLVVFPQMLWAQNYIAAGDSCFKVKDYVCAGTNYDLYLKTDDSNGIAYRAAKAWSLAKDHERAIAAIQTYIRCNYENGMVIFSKMLLTDTVFNFIKDDLRWRQMLTAVQLKEDSVLQKQKHQADSALAYQNLLEKESLFKKLDLTGTSLKTAYQKIRNYRGFPQITSRYISMQFAITDSLHTAYLLVLPKHYDPKQRYPLLFSLHGAVMYNTGYMDFVEAQVDTGDFNRFYTKHAQNVIMVYPHANREYNWMYNDDGFFMVPAMLKQIKQIINADDNRVFITGHSNGATGSFSYLMKQPSPFAAFYGFNTRPRVETGGTYLHNILNRSFFNVSTDQDYYYPPGANDSLIRAMQKIGADYRDHRYNGFPHWFPQFNESEPAHQLLFTDLAKRQRNPFHSKIYWECDDVKYGQCDWMRITGLDTLAKKASWQKEINFNIHKWLVPAGNNKYVSHDTLLTAYKYIKKSGTIKARFNNNVFNVESSRVKSFSILLSPEMVDFNKPVTIIVNGKKVKEQMVKYNKAFMLANFKATADRKAIWVNHIDVTLP